VSRGELSPCQPSRTSTSWDAHGAGGTARAGPLVPPPMCPYFPRMVIGCQRLAGHPAQMGAILPVTPKPLGSSLRNELKPLQHSGNQKALRCFLVPWIWLAQQVSVLCRSEDRALPSGGDWGRGNGHLEEASLAWQPGHPARELMVPPAPPARSARPHPHPCPHRHRAYPGGQALLAVQADSTLVGDLGEVFILKLLEADVMGEPGGRGEGVVTHGGQEGAGWRAASGQGAAPPVPGEALLVFTGKEHQEGRGLLPAGMGLSPPNGWAWHGPWLWGDRRSTSLTSPCLTEGSRDVQAERAWNRQHSQPCPRRFSSHHPRDALGLSQLDTDTQRGEVQD